MAPTLKAALPPLPKRQEQLLRFIYGYYSTHRYFPTHKECAEAMGVAGAVQYLEPLIKKGYLARRASGVHRNLQITQTGLEKLELLGVSANQQQLNLTTP